MKIILTIATAVFAFNASNAWANDAQHQEQTKSATATPADEAAKNLLMHHLGSFQDNDLEAVISDYTSESVLITADATYKGPKEIRAFFSGLIPHFPKHKSNFELDKMVVNDGMALIVWHAKTPTVDVPFATDTFVVKAGKIYRQTFAGPFRFTGK